MHMIYLGIPFLEGVSMCMMGICVHPLSTISYLKHSRPDIAIFFLESF